MHYLALLRQNNAFLVHLTAYLAVNVLLAFISLGGSEMEYWFLWPLAGWGIGILFHAYCVVARSNQSKRAA